MSAGAFSNALLNGSVALIGAAVLALGAIFLAAAVRGSALMADAAGNLHRRYGKSTMCEVSAGRLDRRVRAMERYPGVRTGPRTVDEAGR